MRGFELVSFRLISLSGCPSSTLLSCRVLRVQVCGENIPHTVCQLNTSDRCDISSPRRLLNTLRSFRDNNQSSLKQYWRNRMSTNDVVVHHFRKILRHVKSLPSGAAQSSSLRKYVTQKVSEADRCKAAAPSIISSHYGRFFRLLQMLYIHDYQTRSVSPH